MRYGSRSSKHGCSSAPFLAAPVFLDILNVFQLFLQILSRAEE